MSALDRMVLDHLALAQRFAVRLTGDVDSAEELVQEAMVRAAGRWTSFRGEAAFRTWFFRILINVFRDQLRRRRVTLVSLDDEPEDVPDAKTVDPPDAAMAVELGERVAGEISRLPPRQREVLVLVAFEGLAIGEVARIVGITEQNAHSTLSAARTRLKQRLARYLGFAEA